MPMELDFFTPRVLTGVINLRPIKYDLFTNFFKPQDPKPVDVFMLETSLRGASILPSITNYDAGTMRKGETLSVGYVPAPRFRPKRAFRAADLLKTQKGFTPYDPRINPVERAIADDMDAHRDDIDRMLEIMCAQAANDGADAGLRFSGFPGLNLVHFLARPDKPDAPRPKRGVSVKIKRSGKRYVPTGKQDNSSKPFVAKIKKAGSELGMFVRYGKGKRRHMLYGPSPIQALQSPERQEKIRERIEEIFKKRLTHELDVRLQGIVD